MTDSKTSRRFLQETGGLALITLAGCPGGDPGTEGRTKDNELTEDGAVRPLDDCKDGYRSPAVGNAIQVPPTPH